MTREKELKKETGLEKEDSDQRDQANEPSIESNSKIVDNGFHLAIKSDDNQKQDFSENVPQIKGNATDLISYDQTDGSLENHIEATTNASFKSFNLAEAIPKAESLDETLETTLPTRGLDNRSRDISPRSM
jgi:hypothetical protein